MSNIYTAYAISLGPLVIVLVFAIAAAMERRRAGAAAEHRRERVALRAGQPTEVTQHGRAELVQAA